MKFSKYIIATTIAAMTAGLSSCGSDWLEITNNTQDPVEDYYTTADNIWQSVVAAYDPMHWFDYANNYTGFNIYPEVLADQCLPGGGDVSDMDQWKTVFDFNTTATKVLDTNYSNAYSGVKRCNDALRYMTEYWKPETDADKALRARYESEVTALRVFFYNHLWHWWGNIVYYDNADPLTAENGYIGTQYTASEVYEKMIKDLEDVIKANALPEKCSGEELGRVTKHFVYMLYTEIVMYQNDESRKPTALQYMEEIISSGKYSLMQNFADIWDVTGEWCQESVFEINYSDFQASRNWNWGGTAGGTVVPCMVLPRGYDSRDGIHDNTGWGFCTVRKSTYDSYDPADTRRDVSIWIPEEGSYTVGYQDTGYFVAKYAGKIGGNSGQIADALLNYNNNLRIYRYSEVLLNAAELGSGNKQAYLDQVRQRAGVGSVTATQDNIIQERAWEFLGEGKRYWDLIRTGLAKDYLVPGNEYPDDRKGRYTDNKKYLPFPQSEIDYCHGTLKQNDQYFQ